MCTSSDRAVDRLLGEHELRGELRRNEPMASYVSWRAGGIADQVYSPADSDDMAAYLRCLPAGMPVYCVGLGSNLLVRDGGVRGAVILLHGALRKLRLEDMREAYGVIYAEAGIPSPKLARFAANHNLVGAEFMAGIPGTVGGALAMNAGCYGSETWQIAVRALTMNRLGQLQQRERDDYAVGYRHAQLHTENEEWFVGAWFVLSVGDGALSRLTIKELLQRRIASQPLGQPNAGSVFRNPSGDYAARLIDICGLKGKQIGGAQVSPKHANFIVNLGAASATDIEELIEHVAATVATQTGVMLQCEVRIIGDRVEGGRMTRSLSDLIRRAPREPLVVNGATARRAAHLTPHSRPARATKQVRQVPGLGKVGVLLGGRSVEREISLQSGLRVLASLQRQGVDAHPFDPAEQDMAALAAQGFDRVMIALHGRFGEDGTVQGALDWMDIPYTGSGVMASALAMDKWRTKLVWQAAGIPTPDFAILDANTDFEAVVARLGLPIFVKPAREGSSIGMSRVTQAADLRAAWAMAAQYDALVLAEQCIDSGEYTCAILGDQVLPMIRLVPNKLFYDYEAKYLRDDTEYRVPCGLSIDAEQAIQALAKKAFDVLGCRGWGRLDLMLDAAGKPYFLEANTSPGMTEHSLVPMAALAAGISFDELVLTLLEQARVG